MVYLISQYVTVSGDVFRIFATKSYVFQRWADVCANVTDVGKNIVPALSIVDTQWVWMIWDYRILATQFTLAGDDLTDHVHNRVHNRARQWKPLYLYYYHWVKVRIALFTQRDSTVTSFGHSNKWTDVEAAQMTKVMV